MEARLAAQLLTLARWTLERWCADQAWRSGGPALPAATDRPVDGLFVTLRQGPALRGCIGTLERHDSLDATLRQVAVQAAGSDPRFPPVRAHELPSLNIGVSLLTPPEPLADVAALRLGEDGLIIERGRRRGLLLPEVPIELGWDAQRFLTELCAKAFLPPDAWRDPESRLFRFRSERCSETAES
jgi:AmmeMemoRadiSam system protein A